MTLSMTGPKEGDMMGQRTVRLLALTHTNVVPLKLLFEILKNYFI